MVSAFPFRLLFYLLVFDFMEFRDSLILQKSAQLSQKTGLAMGDAIIVQSLIEGGARTVYTTDSDLAKLKIGLRVIKL